MTRKLPPLMGSDNKKWLAAVFASPDLTIAGVPDRWDRKRLRARIAFQERDTALWRREVFLDYGSPDGSFEKVPAANIDAAFDVVSNSHLDVQADCRADLKRPMLLRKYRDSLLNPFHKEGDDNV